MNDFPTGMFDGSFRIDHNHTGANSIFFREESDAWSGHRQSHRRSTGLRLRRQPRRMDATHQGDQCFTKCPEGSVVPYAGGHGSRDHSRANCAHVAKTFGCCSKEGGAKIFFGSNDKCQAKVKSFIDRYGAERCPILWTRNSRTITLSEYDGSTAQYQRQC